MIHVIPISEEALAATGASPWFTNDGRRRDMWAGRQIEPGDQCDGTCTVDCGHCKVYHELGARVVPPDDEQCEWSNTGMAQLVARRRHASWMRMTTFLIGTAAYLVFTKWCAPGSSDVAD